MNVQALHGDMTQGARDGVMISFKDGRSAAAGRHRRRRPRPRHLRHLARHQLRRPDLARRLRPPDRPHRARRPQRPRDHLLRAAPAARDRRRSSATPASSSRRGSRTRAWRRRRSRRRRRAALQAARLGQRRRCRLRKLIIAGGRAEGIEPSDIVHAITAATGLDGEAVRNVRVLERFAFVEVPEPDADRVVELTGGTEVRGHPLRSSSRG